MPPGTETRPLTRRKLILQDSLAFLTLISITIVLFTITLFLFRSFQSHRADLATRWASRGLAAFQAGNPEQAIAAYRTALSYAPDERSYELQLAEALGKAGHTEEAYNYFMGLWETQPGDGFINLQLARLAATKRDVQGAIHSYRASIYGTWQGDGVARRREVRLELARYLIAQQQQSQAHTELLIAAGNSPDTPETDLTLAPLLEQAGAPHDALTFYQKALAEEPKNQQALANAGRLAYTLSDYPTARQLLERATHEDPANTPDTTLLAQTERILQLSPSASLPTRERVDHILTDRAIAKKRLADCTASTATSLNALTTQWAGPAATTTRKALLDDPDKQTAAIQLIDDTERATSQTCPTPTTDDTLLLRLAQHP